MYRTIRIAAAVGVCIAAVALAAGAPPLDLTVIHAARWLSPNADRASALGSTPTECLRAATEVEQAYAIEVGRAAFRTPLTPGGQAARVGLSCDSCHENGRTNPDFFFPYVSGAPGTAARAALLSSHPAEGMDHPKPIPDLSSDKSRLKVDQDPKSAALEPFVHGLVTEEFDGAEQPTMVIRGLTAYLRALSPDACPAASRQPLRAAYYLDDARRSVKVAIAALDHQDAPAAAFLTESARSQLGLIYERYDQPQSDAARAALHAADLQLVAAAQAVRAHDPRARERLTTWLATMPAWSAVVLAEEPQSLFNVQRLG